MSICARQPFSLVYLLPSLLAQWWFVSYVERFYDARYLPSCFDALTFRLMTSGRIFVLLLYVLP